MPATIPLVVPVAFSGGGLSMQTTTSRISAEGVFIRSLVPPKEGARITLSLSLPGSPRPVNASGLVAPLADAGKGERGFWIRFEPLSEEARSFLDALLRSRGAAGVGRPPPPDATGDGARTYARVPARFRVGWTSARDFLIAYSENISRGGIFIATDNPPALREVVELSIQLPDGKPPVRTKAEVVHSLTPERARATGRVAGAGLQFIGGTDDFRHRLDECISALSD
jgi:uncharacterized protein (TIGR02266 family)